MLVEMRTMNDRLRKESKMAGSDTRAAADGLHIATNTQTNEKTGRTYAWDTVDANG